MSKHARFSKETIVNTCIEIIKTDGVDTLTARSICKKLGCSVAPLFWAFENMDELMGEVRKSSQKLFSDYVDESIEYIPTFKEFGLRLVRFSRENPKLFHYLFLDKDSNNVFFDGISAEFFKQNESHFGLSAEQSGFICQHIWPFACGLALLCSKNPGLYPEEKVSQMLSNQFQALLMQVKSEIQVENIIPKKIENLRAGETITINTADNETA